MKIRDILQAKGSQVVTIGPQATLHEALCTFVGRKVGALPVQDPSGAVLGIVTERDVMREVHAASPIRKKRVEEAMTRNLVTGCPEDEVEYVMTEMTEKRFRHMPVMEDGHLVGILSIGDLVKSQLHRAKFEVMELRGYITGAGI